MTINLNEIIEAMRIQIINNIHHGYRLKPIQLESEWLDAYEHHIPMFNQAQHILWLLSVIPKLDTTNSNVYLTMGFIQGWMFSQELCTINWIKHLYTLHLAPQTPNDSIENINEIDDE